MWRDLQGALDNMHARLRDASHTSGILITALCAIGARRSHHSAITGLDSLGNMDSPDQLFKLGLGRRREAACRSLALRAVALADEQGLARVASQENIEVFSFLRMMVMSTIPRDRSMLGIVGEILKQYRQQSRDRSFVEAESLVATDAAMSILFDQPLDVKDEELATFGWLDIDVDELEGRLRRLPYGLVPDEELYLALRSFTLAIMREIAKLQAAPLPFPARPVLDRLAKRCEAQQHAIIAITISVRSGLAVQPQLDLRKNQHLMKLPSESRARFTPSRIDLLCAHPTWLSHSQSCWRPACSGSASASSTTAVTPKRSRSCTRPNSGT